MSTTRSYRKGHTKYMSLDTTTSADSCYGSSSDQGHSKVVIHKYQPQDLQQQQQAIQGTTNTNRPSVRVDMDLDVDIQLKAKIKGGITLTIL